MKTKLLITLIAVSTLLSCKSGDKNNSLDEEHEEKADIKIFKFKIIIMSIIF